MKCSKFDIADYLDSEEACAAYLTAVFEGKDPDFVLAALGDIARIRGMEKTARKAGLDRETLDKALRPGAKPSFETVFRIMNAMNITMQVQAG